MFQSSNPSFRNDLERIISPTITPEQNADLSKIPSFEEIKDVVFNMAPTKAPGPDGMSAIFLQYYWNTVGRDMVSMIQNFFRKGHMLRELNHTHISLIPKTPHANRVAQFKPISLCNVVYKVITKILPNRLKLAIVLDGLVSPFQSTFIPGRSNF